jgi:hypothetical protein
MRDQTGASLTVCLGREKVTPTPQAEVVAFVDITKAVFESINLALENKSNPWRAISVIARAEKVMQLYASHGFVSLLPIQRELQDTLHTAWRMSRRRFIKAALCAPDEDYDLYHQHFRSGAFDGADAMDDWDAVERHLAHGARLFEGLLRHRVKIG